MSQKKITPQEFQKVVDTIVESYTINIDRAEVEVTYRHFPIPVDPDDDIKEYREGARMITINLIIQA